MPDIGVKSGAILTAVVLSVLSLAGLEIIPRGVSGYTPHGPIVISGSSGFTASNGVTGGTGTLENPYLIEGWEINASGSSGIFIENSGGVYFVITNVYVHHASYGIWLRGYSTNGRIENSVLSQNSKGIYVDYFSNYAVIYRNSIFGNSLGVQVEQSHYATISGNSILSNNGYGIMIGSGSSYATVTRNRVSDNRNGMTITYSYGAVLSGNTFVNDSLEIFGGGLDQYNSHTITSDNTIDSRPLYYYKNCADLTLEGISAGQVIIANCQNVRIANLTQSGSGAGLQLAFVSRGNITGNTLSYAGYGILFDFTNDVTVYANNVSNNDAGIYLRSSSAPGSAIKSNLIHGNRYGIVLTGSSYNTLISNRVSSNSFGIRLMNSAGNVIHHNDFILNAQQALDDTVGGNRWDDGYPSGGNHWSDFVDTDQCSGPLQNICPSPDGVWDTPYLIPRNSYDNYPLLRPSVPRLPVATFTHRPPLARVGENVSFNASASRDPDGLISSYLWDFGDGSFGSGAVVKHTYGAPGAYQVILTVRDNQGLEAQAFGLVLVAGLNLFPYPFVAGGSFNTSFVVGTSQPHPPANAAHTIDVLASIAVAASMGDEAGGTYPAPLLDTEAASSDGTNITLTARGHLITFGGRGVNWVTRYFNNLSGNQGPPVRQVSNRGICTTDSNGTPLACYRRSVNTTTGYTVDYAFVTVMYDPMADRFVLMVVGLSGYATRAMGELVAARAGTVLTGTGTITEMVDLEGDGRYDSFQVVAGTGGAVSMALAESFPPSP